MAGAFYLLLVGRKGLSALLGLLLLSFMLAPLLRYGLATFITSVFYSLLLLTGIPTISHKMFHQVGVGVLAVIGITLNWMRQFNPESWPLQIWSDLISLCYLMLLTLVVIRHVFQEGPVTMDRIRGAIAAYILVGFTWAIIYRLIELLLPGSFHLTGTAAGNLYLSYRSEFTYFSFVTMTTLGYGDITPIHPMARMFVILEALIGQLYPATLLARLVSLQIGRREAGSARYSKTGEPHEQ